MAVAIQQESLIGASEPPTEKAGAPESVKTLILAAIGWWLLVELSSGLVGFVIGLMRAAGVANVSVNNPIAFIAMAILASAVLFIAVRKRSAIVGHGKRRAGVGDRPILRWWLLIVLALLAAIWGFFATAFWSGLVPQFLAGWRQASPWTVTAFACVTVVLAPFAEELFFRGWLWTGLRQHWRVFPTALLTGGLWLLVHLERGFLVPLFLLPTAVILGFARHFCGIRASMIVHATYNLMGVLILLFMLNDNLRCSLAFDRKDYDRAITDCDRAVGLNPKFPPNYVIRGRAHAHKGDFTLAIADYTQAIGIDRKYAGAYEARANARRDIGSFDLAIADYNEAIHLNSKSAFAFYGRGVANFYVGARVEAASDLNVSNALDPKNAYTAIWLEIARSCIQLPSLLKQETTEIDMTKWPAPVIRLFLGEISAADVLAAANVTDANTTNDQVCEANFYSGEVELQKGNKENAVRLFRLAVAHCPKTFDEFSAANAELKSLGLH